MSTDETPRDASKSTSTEKLPPRAPLLTRIRELFGIGKTFTLGAILTTAAILVAGLILFVNTAPPTTITITSGPEGSIFQTNAYRYADILAKHGITVKVLTSHGSLDNLQRLSDHSVHVDVGFVQGGVTNDQMHKLVSLGSVSYQPLLVFYRGASIDLLSGLAGKRVAIGPLGSGTRALALTLLQANGIRPDASTTLLDWAPAESSKALLEGSVDAAFLMGEDASVAVMRELLRAPDVHLLSFKQAVAYTRRLSYLSLLELPEGSIDLGKNIPAQDVHLIGPTVELIARKSLHPALSDFLLEAAREVHGRATLLQRKNEFPAPLEHDFRISLDAARFYKSGRSFFYRYLPFWLASLTSRIVVVFVPMVVVLIPLLRSIPFLYRWRVRSRIFRWYRALLNLERELFSERGAAHRDHFLRRLDDIEQAVNTMKVPASFADQFYGLRQHIEFVRGLVQNTAVK
jgi:NMT1 family protein